MKYLLFLGLLFLSSSIVAQSFSAKVNRDTIYMGNSLELTFSIDNLKGEFSAPDLYPHNVITGPNTSMVTQFMNGEMSSSEKYGYIINPKEIGEFIVEKAELVTKDTIYYTDPLSYIVIDNPEGIIQESEKKDQLSFGRSFWFNEPREPSVKEKPKNESKLNSKLKKI